MDKYIGKRSGGKTFELIKSLQEELEEKRQTISTLEEQISWVEKGNERLRKKLEKYKKVLKLLVDELELGLNKETEKCKIDGFPYFEMNRYWLVHNNGNIELLYLDYELLQEVLNEKED